MSAAKSFSGVTPGGHMLAGLGLFWVGAVLFCNGLWVLEKIGNNEIGVIDVFVGSLTLLIALYSAFGPGADLAAVRFSTFLLLFTFTYFWVAWNRWNGADGRGLGWFCLFVAITCMPISAQTLIESHGNFWQIWLGINWASWCVLWFLFYLILAAKRAELSTLTGVLCTAEGIYTGWIPGYLLVTNMMPGVTS
jgi:putative amide transporter protein